MAATKSSEKELVELERKYWRALQERDAETAIELTDFPCIVTGPQGVAKLGREVFVTMMEHARHTIGRAELSDMQVRLVRDDVAVVAYKVHEEVEVDGVAVHFEAADSSTWVRRNGHWACAAHAEALLGDAFGRDRS